MSLAAEIFCVCGSTAHLKEDDITVTYRGKKITVLGYYYKCPHCNEELTTTESDTITLERVHWMFDEDRTS